MSWTRTLRETLAPASRQTRAAALSNATPSVPGPPQWRKLHGAKSNKLWSPFLRFSNLSFFSLFSPLFFLLFVSFCCSFLFLLFLCSLFSLFVLFFFVFLFVFLVFLLFFLIFLFFNFFLFSSCRHVDVWTCRRNRRGRVDVWTCGRVDGRVDVLGYLMGIRRTFPPGASDCTAVVSRTPW